MRYEIKGDTLPVVVCYLENGERMITERGSMSWMSPNMKMETTSNGGIGKAFGRMFSGEALFQNRYTATGGNGMIAFASSFPGQIVARQIAPGQELIVQKSGFLASEEGVDLSIFFQKKFGAGFFGGEGFIMQRLSGNGIAFLEFDGHVLVSSIGGNGLNPSPPKNPAPNFFWKKIERSTPSSEARNPDFCTINSCPGAIWRATICPGKLDANAIIPLPPVAV